jgi:hypothetical protein
MVTVMQSFLYLGLIVVLEIVIYIIFLKPIVDTWGATKEEANMTLIGDELVPTIISTRAISINAPISEVWRYLVT